MAKVLLIKYGEIALKGLNRKNFEKLLEKNIVDALRKYKKATNNEELYFEIEREQSTMTIECQNEEFDIEKIVPSLSKVFGIAAINLAVKTTKDIEEIKKTAIKYISPALEGKKSFGVYAKRSDKSFPQKSPEIALQIGGALYESNQNIKVDLKHPEVQVGVEIRANGAFVHAASEKYRAAGGLPVGSNGEGLLLLSGGIDSPVAGYMMARRGMKISALHFESTPYTSERAREKAMRLSEILSEYCGEIEFFTINLAEIQETIKKCCHFDYATILLRRFMLKIAQKIASYKGLDCLITGEALGQVASQTIEAIESIYYNITVPVLRPCIGLDKSQIIEIAQHIGTYETSIEPYEDCCSLFAPRHPVTKPKLQKVLDEEKKILDMDGLIERAMETPAARGGTLGITRPCGGTLFVKEGRGISQRWQMSVGRDDPGAPQNDPCNEYERSPLFQRGCREAAGDLQNTVISKLREKNLTLATAESCTGGLVGKRLTEIPGSSEVYLGGVVSYANSAKTKLLGVCEETLGQHGAVSEQTALEMCVGAAKALCADIGVSTTGIAGPGGGSEKKPVGLVYVGIYYKNKDTGEEIHRAKKLELAQNAHEDERETIRWLASSNALSEILNLL